MQQLISFLHQKATIKFYNVLGTFADNGWRYTRDGDGECMYKCYFIDGSIDMYRQLNEAQNTLTQPM